MDRIYIKELEVFAHHGVYDNEKEKGQRFIINAKIYLNTIKAGITDNLDDTLDYGRVCEFMKNYMVVNQINLLETLTNDLSRKLLLNFPMIDHLSLEICKPEAPIPMKFDIVSIKVQRGRHTAYIAVGSNIGDKEAYIRDAIDNLASDDCITLIKESDLIETKPYGYEEQDDFLNGVFKIKTLYSPEELLERLHEEEDNASRERIIHWGPRTLDLDIILYDDLVMSTDNLVIPHPDMTNRTFVMEPLCQIDPYVVHPRYGLNAKEILCKLKQSMSLI